MTDKRRGRPTAVMTVNGHDLAFGQREIEVMNMLLADGVDCLPAAALAAAVKQPRQLSPLLARMRRKLRPAGADIVFFPGEGYRLQNLEGET